MHGIIIWPTNLCLSNMCMPISYIHIISYNHCCTINVLGWKCKHNSSTLPPRCLKHCRLFSISHTSFGIASRGQCGWSLHDTWKIITYEPTSRRHQPNKISSIWFLHIISKWKRSGVQHHLKLILLKPVVKNIRSTTNRRLHYITNPHNV